MYKTVFEVKGFRVVTKAEPRKYEIPIYEVQCEFKKNTWIWALDGRGNRFSTESLLNAKAFVRRKCK